MNKKIIASGVIHNVPEDLQSKLQDKPEVLTIWNDLTPLARNEWICWITSAKKEETRKRRITWGFENLLKGKRRPCCWPGCPHRS